MKKFVSFLLAAALCAGFALPAHAANEATAAEVLAVLGIMNGDENGDMNLSSPVTRAEFAKMLVCASQYKDSAAGASNSSPFRDVPYTHWAAGYIKVAVQQGWVTGYLDGTYRPENTITLEEAVSASVKLLGYTNSDFSGTYPQGQLALYRSLGMDQNVTAAQGTKLTRENCMYLVYNLLNAKTKNTGQTYAETLGHAVDTATGEIDYVSLLNDQMDGPVLTKTAFSAATLGFTPRTVYRNGAAASAGDIAAYDVLYYSESLSTVWAYSSRVTGTYEKASPSIASPTSVTVAGSAYSVSGEALRALSAAGELNVGDTVTLLLGRDGTAVFALKSDELSQTVYGVVTAKGTTSYTSVSGGVSTAETVTLTATDGASYTYKSGRTDLALGDLVTVGASADASAVARLSKKRVSGTVSAESMTLGKYSLASDVRILDAADGTAVRIYPARLDGAHLEEEDVLFYRTDSAGRITDLILNDYTSDGLSYGIMTDVRETDDGLSLSGSYTYLIGGQESSFSMQSGKLSAKGGPSAFRLDGGQLASVKSLTQVKDLAAVTETQVIAGDGTVYTLSEQADVYVYEDFTYLYSNLQEVRGGAYNLRAYYDREDSAGGRVRIIIATPK